MAKTFLATAAAVVLTALAGSAHATTWFTIVSDRGCTVSAATPAQFQEALLIKEHRPSRQERKYWPNGSFLGVDVIDTDASGERNQWFFLDAQTCLEAAKVMGVSQQ